LPEGGQTLAHVLNGNGYRTAWFGKWHVDGPLVRDERGQVTRDPRPQHESAPEGGLKRETHQFKPPEARGGFETWIGYENNNSPHNTWVHGHDEDGEVDLYRLPGFETDSLTDLLIDYLHTRADDAEPFFAALSVQPPHDRYAAPEEFMRNYNPATLELRANVPEIPWVEERARRDLAGAYALVENLDWNLGRVRQALRELDLDTNTEIIFFSDHGDLHGSHGQFHKTNPLEESVGVPMIFGGGLDVQGMPINKAPDNPIGLVDLAPTTLGFCGIDPPEWMEGYDYSYLKTKRWGDPVPTPEEEPDAALIQLVIPTGHGDSTDRAWRGIVTRCGWKYVCFENTDWLMFDLNTDPLEQANLAHNTKYGAKRAQLRERLVQLLAETGDEFTVPQ
jgi:arylsulfatase A-like enzyme